MEKAKKQHDPHAVHVIETFGGTGKVAVICGVTPASVSCWKVKGIPQAREQYLRLLNPAAFQQHEGR
jgi:hypothetical protein